MSDCKVEYRFPHTWVAMEKAGLEIPRNVRAMLEERDRDLEDFLSNLPYCCCDPVVGDCEFLGYGEMVSDEGAGILGSFAFDGGSDPDATTDGTWITTTSAPPPPGITLWNVGVYTTITSTDVSAPANKVWSIIDDDSNVLETDTIGWTGSSGAWEMEVSLATVINYTTPTTFTVTVDSLDGSFGSVEVWGGCLGTT